MPHFATLERFIARVEQNLHAEALEEFYSPEATLQENPGGVRNSRAACIAKEQVVRSKARTMESHCVRPAFISGDWVAIRWVFRFEWLDGTVTRIEEVAMQRWEDDLIAEETFFYDPAQRAPVAPT